MELDNSGLADTKASYPCKCGHGYFHHNRTTDRNVRQFCLLACPCVGYSEDSQALSSAKASGNDNGLDAIAKITKDFVAGKPYALATPSNTKPKHDSEPSETPKPEPLVDVSTSAQEHTYGKPPYYHRWKYDSEQGKCVPPCICQEGEPIQASMLEAVVTRRLQEAKEGILKELLPRPPHKPNPDLLSENKASRNKEESDD